MIGDHVEGFGLLKNSAIDQHLLRRNRQFDLIDVVDKHPELLGIGIDENTAIVVRGDEFDVIGQSYVVIYDNKAVVPPSGRFYFLAPGDRFDLAKREASRGSQQFRPLNVARRPASQLRSSGSSSPRSTPTRPSADQSTSASGNSSADNVPSPERRISRPPS